MTADFDAYARAQREAERLFRDEAGKVIYVGKAKSIKKRVAGPENTTFFISLVKQAGIQDKVTKLIRPKRD